MASESTGPIKIVLERLPRQGAEESFRRWTEQFVEEASRASGHEGGSVLSGRGGSHLILLRFASAAALEAWQRSSGYESLMRDADAVSTAGDQAQIQSGLETWFTLPDRPAPIKPPAKWKMALVTWLALLPMVIALAYIFAPLALPFLLNAAASTAIPVVMLTWVIMPRATRVLYRWLYAGVNTVIAALKQIDAGVLNVGYVDVGPASAPAVVLLHGWPYDIHTYADVAPLLAANGYRVIVPYLRGFGTTHFLASDTPRNGQQSALAADVIALMDALCVGKAIVAGCDWGARTAGIVAAVWPERCKGLVSVSGYLIGSREASKKPLSPKAELEWWYQFYFATERGRAGYEMYRREFARLIWQLASPRWKFDEETFARSAESFDNHDHVSIVIHNYRWRLGLAEGEAKYDSLEEQLAKGPLITVPTITMEGDSNGAPHPDPRVYAKKFAGKYAHRLLSGGVGHNLPQEAPQDFAAAIFDVDRL